MHIQVCMCACICCRLAALAEMHEIDMVANMNTTAQIQMKS